MANQMLLSAQKVRFEDLRILSGASLSGSFTAVGAPFANPVRMLKVTNLADADLFISFDGVTAKDVIASESAFIYDFCSNLTTQAGNFEFAVGNRVYVSLIGAAPTNSKDVYVTVIYASTV